MHTLIRLPPSATSDGLELSLGKQIDGIEEVDRAEVAAADRDRVVRRVAEQLLRSPWQGAGDIRGRAEIVVVLRPEPADHEAHVHAAPPTVSGGVPPAGVDRGAQVEDGRAR